MLPPSITSTHSSPASISLRLRYFVLFVVLFGEVLLLEICFDGGALARESGIWAQLISRSSQVLSVGIASVAAFALLGGSCCKDVLQRHAQSIRKYSAWPHWFVVQLVCCAFFAFASGATLGNHAVTSGIWSIVWVLTGILTAVAWCLAALPPQTWRALAASGYVAMIGSLLVGISAWYVGYLSSHAWEPLASGTFTVVASTLHCIYSDVQLRPSDFEIGTSRFSVVIAPQCSGYEGIGLITVFLVVYLLAFRARLRFPQSLLLIPVGMVAIWLLNALRIAALIAIGTSWSPQVAHGGFHSQAGWLAFNLVALGLVAATTRSPIFSRLAASPAPADAAAQSAVSESNFTAAYLGPFLAALAVGMVTGAFAGDFDWLFPLRSAAALAVICMVRSALPRPEWSFSWIPIGVGAGVCGLWITLLPVGVPSKVPVELVGHSSLGAAAWIACRFVGYAVITPIIEELAFRGYLMRRWISPDFQKVPWTTLSWPALLASSIAFGAMHGSHWLAGTAAGLLFAWMAVRRGRIGDAIVSHAVANFLLASYAVLTGNWNAWS